MMAGARCSLKQTNKKKKLFLFFFFGTFFPPSLLSARARSFFFYCRQTIGHSLEGYQIYFFIFLTPPFSSFIFFFPYSFRFCLSLFTDHKSLCRFCTTLSLALCVCVFCFSLLLLLFNISKIVPLFYVRVV